MNRPRTKSITVRKGTRKNQQCQRLNPLVPHLKTESICYLKQNTLDEISLRYLRLLDDL